MANKERQWERVQERAFTQWMSQTVQADGMSVQDLRLDIQDGLKMIRFFELLSGKKVKQNYNKNPKNRITKISNLSVALDFLKEMGVMNPGCAAEDIIDAETKGIKMILGLLWSLFRRYKMSEAAEDGSKTREEDAILEWVRKTTDGYPGINVTSFRTSFNDGKVFLALVHAFNKDDPEFDFEEMCKLSTEEVLETAFDVAERRLGITKLLDVQEFLDGNVDERSISLYTTLFVSAFKARDKMLELQADLGDKQNALAIENSSREELTKLNSELSLTAAQLQKSLEDEQEHAKSLDALCDELKRENLDAAEEAKRLREQLAELEATLAALSSQNDAELEEKLAKERELAAQINAELEKENAAVKELEDELERLTKALNDKKNDNDETSSAITKRTRKARTNISGLKVVHSNLDQHYEDLTHWQRYLPGSATSASADSYMLSLAEELDKLKTMEDFEAQTVELLKARFDAEEKEMAKLLEQRRELEKTGAKK